MDWFSTLTGFREGSYDDARAQLRVEGDELVSAANDKRFGVGSLSVPTLAELRSRIAVPDRGRTSVQWVVGESRAMHSDPALAGALFQVASQFNLLEMTGPNVTPEHGVTRYASDHTQGPACAIAAGAATIYRNYFAPVDGESGQTRDRQVDALAAWVRRSRRGWAWRCASCGRCATGTRCARRVGSTLSRACLMGPTTTERDEFRSQLAIGVHRDVEVTDVREDQRRLVSQAFCSALPVAYGGGVRSAWEAFGRLVLEASYEATLLTAVEQYEAGGSDIVLLTRVGGGVFGNADAWIDDAITRALTIVADAGLDVRLVSYGQVHPSFRAIAERFDE